MKLGKCELCSKDIESVPGLDKNPNDAVCVLLSNQKIPLIQGSYGSVIFDCNRGYFSDYHLFVEFYQKLSENLEKQLYICDDCIQKLINVDKIVVFDNVEFPSNLIRKDNGGYILSPLNFEITNEDIFIPIQRECLCLKFNNGAKRLCKIANRYFSFRYQYLAKYFTMQNNDLDQIEIVYIIDKNTQDRIKSIEENQVLILYENGLDFDVMDEVEFKKRFTYKGDTYETNMNLQKISLENKNDI